MIECVVEVVEGIVVGNTKNAIAYAFQSRGSSGISGQLGLSAMRCTVDLNDDLALAAQEVGEVRANRRLANEFQTAKPPASKMTPYDIFGGSLPGA